MKDTPIVILVGGQGTRLREQTEFIPKGLVPVGGIPMVVHIMRLYSYYGYNNFILALGYKGHQFKEYFTHYADYNNDITIDIGGNTVTHHSQRDKDFRITLVDTGENSLKSTRMMNVEKYIKSDTFMMTYGDAVSDINITNLLNFHDYHGKMATVTGVHTPSKFGEIHVDGIEVTAFSEKPVSQGRISGGFFVFNKKVYEYISGHAELEDRTLPYLANRKELAVYEYDGFWKNMDTIKDVDELEKIWRGGDVPWVR